LGLWKKWKKYDVLATYSISAFWHGFYPGYYISFGWAAFATILARLMRRKFRPYFVDIGPDGKEIPRKTKIIYDILSVIATSFTLSYIMSSFPVLSLSGSWNMYYGVHFSGHILFVVCYLFVSKFIRTRKLPNTEGSNGKEGRDIKKE